MSAITVRAALNGVFPTLVTVGIATAFCIDAASSQEPPQRFAIREVLPAQPPRGQTPFVWTFPGVGTGDFDKDGIPERLTAGWYFSHSTAYTLDAYASIRKGGAGQLLWSRVFDRSVNHFTSPFGSQMWVMLGTPFGPYAIRVSDDREHFAIQDLNGGGVDGFFDIPNPFPGGLGNFPIRISRADDIDGDGFDDFLYEGSGLDPQGVFYLSVALVSGATMDPFWVLPQQPHAQFTPLVGEIDRFPVLDDLDGDGYRDVLVRWTQDPGARSREVRALSGRDGSTLWEHSFPRPSTYSAESGGFAVGDLDGDGIRDLLGYVHSGVAVGEPGYLRAVSTVDGSVIWEVTAFEFDPYFSLNPPNGSSIGAFWPWPDVNGDGIDEFVSSFVLWPDVNGVTQQDFWVFDGATGHFLTMVKHGLDTFDPWSPLAPVSFALGTRPTTDVDGDGWPESSLFAPSDPQNPIAGGDYALISPESLRLPDSPSIGVALDCKIHIPSSPNSEFQLVFSQGFRAGNAALHVQDWNTNLVADQAMRRLAGLAGSSGTLDAHGWYAGKLTLPAGAGLEGRQLYVRGVIREQNGIGKIRTLTTLSILDVQ